MTNSFAPIALLCASLTALPALADEPAFFDFTQDKSSNTWYFQSHDTPGLIIQGGPYPSRAAADAGVAVLISRGRDRRNWNFRPVGIRLGARTECYFNVVVPNDPANDQINNGNPITCGTAKELALIESYVTKTLAFLRDAWLAELKKTRNNGNQLRAH